MKELRVPALTLAAVILAVTAASALPPKECPHCGTLSDVTKRFIALMNDGGFRAAVERFDDRLKRELPEKGATALQNYVEPL